MLKLSTSQECADKPKDRQSHHGGNFAGATHYNGINQRLVGQDYSSKTLSTKSNLAG